MQLTTPLFLAIASGNLVYSACSIGKDYRITFYGSPDNDPPNSTDTAYNCGRGNVAGGKGTYKDPLTFAGIEGEFTTCDVVYLPYLKKYLVAQDFCAGSICGTSKLIDVWTGDENGDGRDQNDCELALTPDARQAIIKNPPNNLEVDQTLLWNSKTGKCGTKAIFPGNKPAGYC